MFPIWNKLYRMFSSMVWRRRGGVLIPSNTIRPKRERTRRARERVPSTSASIVADIPQSTVSVDTEPLPSQPSVPLTPILELPQVIFPPPIPLPLLPAASTRPSTPPVSTSTPSMPPLTITPTSITPEPATPVQITPAPITSSTISPLWTQEATPPRFSRLLMMGVRTKERCRAQRDCLRKAWLRMSDEQKISCRKQATEQSNRGNNSRRWRRNNNRQRTQVSPPQSTETDESEKDEDSE